MKNINAIYADSLSIELSYFFPDKSYILLVVCN